MSNDFSIRESMPSDTEALEDLYPAAFPDEDLIPLLRDLLSEEDGVFSFVAVSGEMVVGHVAFTMCGIEGREEKIGLLAPLAVSPRAQRQGIGTALVQEGLNRLKSEGATQVQVLGDPAYYGRFGFQPDSSLNPPYALPREWLTAWQSISLQGAQPELDGTLSVPKLWRQPALWAE